MTRTILSGLVGLVIARTGFRFSKEYRWGVSRFHRAVYAIINTVTANHVADGGRFFV